MKNKLLCIFLMGIILALLLAGCRRTVKEREDKKEVVKLDNSGLAYEWKIEKAEIPSFPDTTRKEIWIVESVQITTATTFLNMDVNEMKDKIATNKYISDNFILAIDKNETIKVQSYEAIGDKTAYTNTDSVCGKSKDLINSTDYIDFNISLRRNTAYYDNYSCFSFVIHNIPSLDMQENTYEAMKCILPEEIAKYLAYAEDEDEVEDKLQLNIDVNSPDTNTIYTLKRELYKSEGRGYIKYEITVKDLLAEKNKYLYYDGEYTSMHQRMQYTLPDILPSNVGVLDIGNYTSLFNRYMRIGGKSDNKYTQTILEVAHIRNVVGDDGVNKITYSLSMKKEIEGIPVMVAPKTKIEITVVEKDGIIVEIKFILEGDVGYSKEVVEEESQRKQELVKAALSKLYLLFPDVDTSNIVYADFVEGTHSGYQTVDILGKNVNLDYLISTGTKDFDKYYYSYIKIQGSYVNEIYSVAIRRMS